MQVVVSADDPVRCDEELIRRVEGVIEGTLERFRDRIARLEVHLGDLDSPKPGERDKSCRMEARVAGLKPVVASHDAVTLTEAIHAAASKLEHSVAHELQQMAKQRASLSLNGETRVEPSK
jgi:predicted nuclease with TOPRIM domain